MTKIDWTLNSSTLAIGLCVATIVPSVSAETIDKQFTEMHPLIANGEYAKRYTGTNLEQYMDVEDVAGARVSVRLPANYDSTTAHPLIICLKIPLASMPETIPAILDKYGIVWAFVHNTGTDKHDPQPWVKRNTQLALNAAHGMLKAFPIDSGRVYVGGISGGSAASISVAPLFPEIFRGGLFFSSSGPLDATTVAKSILDKTRKSGRYVFTVGNRGEEVGKQITNFRSAGIQTIFLRDIEADGHNAPPGPGFEECWLWIEGNAK